MTGILPVVSFSKKKLMFIWETESLAKTAPKV